MLSFFANSALQVGFKSLQTSERVNMPIRRVLSIFVLLSLFLPSLVLAGRRDGWESKKVDLRTPGGRRITSIHYPKDKEVHTRSQKKARVKKIRMDKKIRPVKALSDSVNTTSAQTENVSTGSVIVNTIESPPVNGFIPWIAVSMTDARSDEYDFYGHKELSVTGDYLPDDPAKDFAIGLYDTGASAHVVGYRSSEILNLDWRFEVDTDPIEISGVTGSVFAWITKPLGLFIAGLNAVEPTAMTLDTSKLVGESNVSVSVGFPPEPNAPDLPTAIGSPMSVFYSAVIKNDQPVTVHFDGKNYTAPTIDFFDVDSDNPNIPTYPIKLPLELRPEGVVEVAYVPTVDMGTAELYPSSPSVLLGNSTQSLFFVHSAKLKDRTYETQFTNGFMIDTGAQVTVIGNQMAAFLGINPNDPEFVVDIEGVNGQIVPISGYYIDSIEIPALGEWLTFTNVPVILLEVSSPEGGKLDGIIGMNLFNEYNMVFHGGGMFLQDAPSLDLELITTSPSTLVGDVAPNPIDGVVDIQDLAVFMQAWLSDSSVPGTGYNPLCDIAPESISDGKINLLDFALMTANWLQDIN